MNTTDFDTYLAQLTPETQPVADWDTLCQLQLAHTCTHAFQSLSTVLHQPISLELDAVYQKVVVQRQGGYCYELNGLFGQLLRHLGYSVRPITGHVVHDNQPDTPHARTHMALLVNVAGADCLVDVGFGGQVPTAPLRLHQRSSQATPHGHYRIKPYQHSLVLSTQQQGQWQMLYAFDLHTQHPIDLEVGNWFVSTHPQSPFRQRLMAARTEPGGKRHSLLNQRYSVHNIGQASEHHPLHNADEILQLLQQVFLLKLPTSPAVHDGLQRFLNQLPPVADTKQ